MSYQVLARKWRPGKFSDLVGQDHVLKTLTHALDSQRLHHAYLFTGTRGVGKTTLARILAKCLNCEQGVTSEPCGICLACTEIAEGRFIDLIEVDAASRTKVEDTRELLENVQYAPSRGRYKIYLIDEVHMLSTHSFNALLKTLEEPPPHVVFLLATTDPQKLPITVLSRCLQFNLKNLSPQQIEEYLEEILQRENIKAENAALWQLAMAAQGSMRDALTLLDQAISFCEGNITTAGVSDMLGTPDQGVVYRLLDCLAESDAKSLLEAIDAVAERAPDFQQLLAALSGTLHRLAIAQVVPDAVDNSHGDREQVLEYAGRFSAEDIQLFYQIALKGRNDLAMAFDSRAMFEMLLIRMLVFSPDGVPTVPQKKKSQRASPAVTEASTGNGVNRVSQARVPAAPAETATAGPEGSGKSGNRREKTDKPARPSAQPESSPEPATDNTDLPQGAKTVENPGPTQESLPPVSGGQSNSSEASGQTATPVATADVALPQSLDELDDRSWIALCQTLHPGGITGSILVNCVVVKAGKGVLKLCLDDTQSAVFGEDHRSRIEQLLAGHFGQPLQVEIDIGKPAVESPAAYSQRIRREQLEELRERFLQDDNVKNLVETFAGEVLVDSISPPGQ